MDYHRLPDGRYYRAVELSQAWATDVDLRHEEPEVMAYARYLRDLAVLPAGHAQESYQRVRPLLTAVSYLAIGLPILKPFATEKQDLRSSATGINAARPEIHDHYRAAAQRDRAVIKAMSLAGESVADIAMYLAMDPAVVVMFERLCWDIRGRLQHRAWLHNFCFTTPVTAETSPQDYERQLLVIAYRLGKDALRRFLVGDLTTTDVAEMDRDYIRLINDKTLTGILTLPERARVIKEVVEARATLMKQRQDAEFKTKELALKADKGPDGDGNDTKQGFGMVLLSRLQTVGFTSANPLAEPMLVHEEPQATQFFEQALQQALAETKV